MANKTVVIFGVFDSVHEGHLAFIREAKSHGDILIAIVARDSVVFDIKNKLPELNEVERINNLLEIPEVDRVLLGDEQKGTYKVLQEVAPDIICLGYDQRDLESDIKKAIKIGTIKKAEIISAKPHKPDELHSSILNKKF